MVASNYFKNRFRKGKGKKPQAKRPPPMKPKQTFAQKVNSIIARNVENKVTESKNFTAPVCQLVGSSLEWYLMNNWDTYQFTIPQGVTENTRVGNQIKLKRWIIKGQIHPVLNFITGGDPGNILPNTATGYLDLYFGRLNTNEEVNNLLPSFLDNGSSSVAPTGQQNQIFKPVNKDAYKIYYHKRFKMAPSISSTPFTGTNGLVPNNDFALTRTFGFDVCKYICKNAVVKFDDSQTTPQNEMIRRLALWATWTPAIGNIGLSGSPLTKHFYNISVCSYAEYEDA